MSEALFTTITAEDWRAAIARGRLLQAGQRQRVMAWMGRDKFAAGKPANGRPSGQAAMPLAAPVYAKEEVTAPRSQSSEASR